MQSHKAHNRSHHLLAWAVLCIVAGLIMLVYLSLGLRASADEPIVMPLDDTYIHFQYARQMASGAPYVYNPGDEPTSGATSFLYSPVLALGYALGFNDMALGFWAVGLGGLFYLLSAWMIYRMVMEAPLADARGVSARYPVALGLALAFLLSGAVAWAAFSGMETLLMTLALLTTLYGLSTAREGLALGAASVAALTRPEGAVVALTVAVVLVVNARRLYWRFAVPILAILVQPLVNFLATGSFSASGNEAKSHLYNSTIPLTERLTTALDFWARIWREWLLGTNPTDGAYLPTLLFLLAMVGVGLGLWQSWQTKQIHPAVVALGWLVGISAGIATLETAFWHFKRYQLPLMALFFPLAGWLLLRLNGRWGGVLRIGLITTIVVMCAVTLPEYARRYRDNVHVVTQQQIAMARWVDDNLPADARVGVHDVGVMRYVGQRATYDMVGLTTEGVAAAWRQGSGTIYDTMSTHPHRPDYFAVYHDIQSLPLLEQAGVFGAEMARFTVPLPDNTVASATSTQIVSRTTWPDDTDPMHTLGWMLPDDAKRIATVDFADLDDEAAIGYRRQWSWWDVELPPPDGFASIVRNLPVAGCESDDCQWVDGVRNTNAYQELRALEGDFADSDIVMILRVHAANPVYVEDKCVTPQDRAQVPDLPGQWVDIPLQLDGVNDGVARFCLLQAVEIAYAWVYRIDNGANTHNPPTDAVQFTNTISGRLAFDFFLNSSYDTDSNTVTIMAQWWSFDPQLSTAKVFVHIYDDVDAPPVRQLDTYVRGYLPPVNWLPGVVIDDTYHLSLDGLQTGTYSLAIGMYEPGTGRRYTVNTPNGEQDRHFLGEIEVEP